MSQNYVAEAYEPSQYEWDTENFDKASSVSTHSVETVLSADSDELPIIGRSETIGPANLATAVQSSAQSVTVNSEIADWWKTLHTGKSGPDGFSGFTWLRTEPPSVPELLGIVQTAVQALTCTVCSDVTSFDVAKCCLNIAACHNCRTSFDLHGASSVSRCLSCLTETGTAYGRCTGFLQDLLQRVLDVTANVSIVLA